MITLRFIDGSESPLQVRSLDRAHIIRSAVSAKLGVTDSRVQLVFGTSLLKRDDIVGQCGIVEGETVNVMIQQPLCPGSTLFNRIVEGQSSSGVFNTKTDVHEALEHMMEKRAKLNDAFAAQMRQRQ